MSAWYILSTLGFYPVNPANGEFVLGAPQIKKASLHLSKGKNFIVEADNITEENFYVQKRYLNNKILNRVYITYNDIMTGGNLRFLMTNK
jgi:putative alpha-1,2-mannosidase